MTDVAVVIAAHDAAETITDALASVATQTAAPSTVVVADDGSIDATADLAGEWVDRLPITVVRIAARGGPAEARARAIETTGAPLIALLDADDVWLPDHLDTMLAVPRSPTTVVMADLWFWVPDEGVGARWSDRYAVPKRDQLRRLYRRNYVNSCTLFSRELYERAGGFRGPSRVGEDWDLWIRMLRCGGVIAPADHPTVRYRMKRAGDAAFADREAVLARAAGEATSAAERRAIKAGMRALRAERQLFAAYDAAAHRPWSARGHGMRAVFGDRRVRVRGAAMVVSPRRVAARRAEAIADPRHRLSG
ncbi:MAG: glycosyltransferase family 2 protein [Acidimicrobiales bacterium]